MTLRVLFVCTGNICRSPMAERLLLSRALAGSVAVSSAGTYGLAGHAMDAQAATVTRALGADADDHVARELDARILGEADVVLTATEEHRDRVLRSHPTMMRRTFTLLEFTRLGRDLPPCAGGLDRDGQLARIAEIAGQRGLVPAPRPGEDDVGDPFGGPLAGMQRCGEVTSDAIDAMIALLDLRQT